MTQLSHAQSTYLTLLSHSPAQPVKDFADHLIPALGTIQVLQNRTGLVMLPATDSVNGTVYHLGEVLVAESQVRIGTGTEGYGMVIGRDLEHAMAIALIDAATQADIESERLQNFFNMLAQQQAAADDLLLRNVEATRVEMETF